MAYERCPACDGRLEPEALSCAACGADLAVDATTGLEPTGYTELVTVFSGTWSEVMPLRAALGTRGLSTVIAHEHMKLTDWAMTGSGTATDVRLQAPAAIAAGAREVIAELRAHRAEEAPEQRARRRRGWLTLMVLFAPVILPIAAVAYGLDRVKRALTPSSPT